MPNVVDGGGDTTAEPYKMMIYNNPAPKREILAVSPRMGHHRMSGACTICTVDPW